MALCDNCHRLGRPSDNRRKAYVPVLPFLCPRFALQPSKSIMSPFCPLGSVAPRTTVEKRHVPVLPSYVPVLPSARSRRRREAAASPAHVTMSRSTDAMATARSVKALAKPPSPLPVGRR